MTHALLIYTEHIVLLIVQITCSKFTWISSVTAYAQICSP